MALKLYPFSKHSDVELHLRGGIKVGPIPKRIRDKVYGLNGLTLVFIQPSAVTVTFADASDQGLSLKDILTQIKTAIGALDPKFKDDCLELVEVSPSAGVSVNLQSSTALTVFGWSGAHAAGTTATNVVHNPPDGAAPRYIDLTTTNQGEGYLLVTEE